VYVNLQPTLSLHKKEATLNV